MNSTVFKANIVYLSKGRATRTDCQDYLWTKHGMKLIDSYEPNTMNLTVENDEAEIPHVHV